MGNFKLSSNVLKCNKIVHSARLTCVAVISCISGTFGGDIAVICGAAHFLLILIAINRKFGAPFFKVATDSRHWQFQIKQGGQGTSTSSQKTKALSPTSVTMSIKIYDRWNRSLCFQGLLP